MNQILQNINKILTLKHLLDCETKKQNGILPQFRDDGVYIKLKPFMSCNHNGSFINKKTAPETLNNYYKQLTQNSNDLDAMCYDMNTLDLTFFPNTILHWTIFNSCIYSAIFLIENRKQLKIDINKQETINMFTPLHSAIIKGRNRCNDNDCNNHPPMQMVIDALIDCDEININIKDKYNNNILDLAMILYDYDTIKHIYDKNPNFVTKQDIVDKHYKKFNDNFGEYSLVRPTYYEHMNETKRNDLRTNYDKIKVLLNLN